MQRNAFRPCFWRECPSAHAGSQKIIVGIDVEVISFAGNGFLIRLYWCNFVHIPNSQLPFRRFYFCSKLLITRANIIWHVKPCSGVWLCENYNHHVLGINLLQAETLRSCSVVRSELSGNDEKPVFDMWLIQVSD